MLRLKITTHARCTAETELFIGDDRRIGNLAADSPANQGVEPEHPVVRQTKSEVGKAGLCAGPLALEFQRVVAHESRPDRRQETHTAVALFADKIQSPQRCQQAVFDRCFNAWLVALEGDVLVEILQVDTKSDCLKAITPLGQRGE